MAPSSPASLVLAALDGIRDRQEDFYRDLHQHPELSHQETAPPPRSPSGCATAGFQVHAGVGGTGVVGVLANGEGPAVLLRADMDALPVREATGLPYASTVTATDADGNEVPVMHACGHDMHVTCLLGAAQLLAGSTGGWHGTVVALFQPAEETGDGARGMVDDHLARIIGTVMSPWPSTSCRAGRTGRHPSPARSCRQPTACGSPCTAAAGTDRCRRRP